MDSQQTRVTREAAVKWFMETQAEWIIKEGIPEWFHGIITRKDAEDLLTCKPPGHFLIRVSESRIGCSLSYRAFDRCRHFMIDMLNDGHFIIVGEIERFRTLTDLVEYHKRAPIQPFNEVLTVPCGQKTNSDTTDYEELLCVLVNKTFVSNSENPHKKPTTLTSNGIPKSVTGSPVCQLPPPTPAKQPAVLQNEPEEIAPPLPPRGAFLDTEEMPVPKPSVLSPLENNENIKAKPLYPSLSEELKFMGPAVPFKPVPAARNKKPSKAHSFDMIIKKKPEVPEELSTPSNKNQAAHEPDPVYSEINDNLVKKDHARQHKASNIGNLLEQQIKNSLPLIRDAFCPASKSRATQDLRTTSTETDKGARKPAPHILKNIKEKLLLKQSASFDSLYSEPFEAQRDATISMCPQSRSPPDGIGVAQHATDLPLNTSHSRTLNVACWSQQVLLPAGAPTHVNPQPELMPPQDWNISEHSHTTACTALPLSSPGTVQLDLKHPADNARSLALCNNNQKPNATDPGYLPYEYLRPPPFAPGY